MPDYAPPHSVHRLVPAPIFVLSSIRSGSTLLRCILNSHTCLHAPHELHLPDLTVAVAHPHARLAMDELATTAVELEHLLWDRLLHRELASSGKSQIIEKTPGNVFSWKRIAACWPDAKYVFLLRDPLHIAISAYRTRSYPSWPAAIDNVAGYLTELRLAMQELRGLTVRYEDLISEPEAVTNRLCRYLGVDWQPAMLTYGNFPQGPFKYGIGGVHSGSAERLSQWDDQGISIIIE
jgi:LPS sulfotransferase NodH